MEVFSDKGPAIGFGAHDSIPGHLPGNAIGLGHPADALLHRGDNAYPEADIGGQDKIGAPSDDDRFAMAADGPDDPHQNMGQFVRPEMALADGGGDPVVDHGYAFLIQAANDAGRGIGILGHGVDDFLIEKIEAELVGQGLGNQFTAAARFPGQRDHRHG